MPHVRYELGEAETGKCIPFGWLSERIKFCVTCNDEALPESTDPDFEISYVDISSVDLIKGITNVEIMPFEKAPSRARRRVKDGDTIVSTVRTYLKAIAPINNPVNNLIVSTGFAVLRPTHKVSPKFLSYFFQSQDFIDAVGANSFGVSYPAINPSTLVCIPCVYPEDKEEQTQIAKFLDYKTAQIDRLIEKKKELIEKLNEQRIAVITQAVTKGLNPEAPMKDSEMDWLGDVPAHWQVRRLRFVGKCQNGINIGGEYFGTGYPFVSYGDVYNNRELPNAVNGLVESSDGDRKSYTVERGDVFFTRTSETIEEIGITAVCTSTILNAVFAGFLIRFRPEVGQLVNNYSKYYFQNDKLRAFFVKEMNLVTRASLSQDLLKSLPVLLPPLDEQEKISRYLELNLKRTTSMIDSNSKVINRLTEYRTALITAAVTGKIDVRQVEIPQEL